MTADKDSAKYGDTVTYTLVVENTGNLTVSDIVVTDPLTGGVTPADGFTLKPGEKKTLTATYTVTAEDAANGSVTNIAEAVGTAVNGTIEVTAEAEQTITAEKIAITIQAKDATKVYDGKPLTMDEIKDPSGLLDGDKVDSVTVTGSQTDVGSSDNVPSDAMIVNAEGEDVTGGYDITYANGTLTVTAGQYEFTKGMGQHWKKGSEKTADFEVTRDEQDEIAYELFKDIEIDGAIVDKSQYRYEEGCVELYISSGYLQTLSVGEHTIRALFEDGVAETTFIVDAEDVKPDQPGGDSPRTGDSNNMILWESLLGASFIGMIVLIVLATKRRRDDENEA